MSTSTKTTYLLTGDIGGTNSRMSLYDTCSSCSNDKPLVVRYYRNANHLTEETHDDPEAFANNIVIPFLEYCWEESNNNKLVPLQDCEILGVLATAGLVSSNNSVKMTNLGNLLVDGAAIEKNTSNKYLRQVTVCRIINDFVAQGYGCLTLKKSEVRHLHGPKTLSAQGPKVCVGAGTGLGVCYLTPSDDSGDYSCFPSEGGHVEYAPRNDVEVGLCKYLKRKFSSKTRISVERVVSGKGLANVYEYLADTFPGQIDQEVHQEFLKAADEQGRMVAENATPKSLCRQALGILMSAYGVVVGSAAIQWIPRGGLYVTGGLTPKNLEYITGKDSEFMQAYRDKGRVAPVLENIPLFAVLTEDLGVRGVHKAALLLYQSHKGQSDDTFRSTVKNPTLWVLAAAATAVGVASVYWNTKQR